MEKRKSKRQIEYQAVLTTRPEFQRLVKRRDQLLRVLPMKAISHEGKGKRAVRAMLQRNGLWAVNKLRIASCNLTARGPTMIREVVSALVLDGSDWRPAL